MAKKPVMMGVEDVAINVDHVILKKFELIQLEQLRKGIRISPCRGSENPSTKSYIVDVTFAELMTEEKRLETCQTQNSDIDKSFIRRHYNFILKEFPNLLKEEVQETTEGGLKILRNRFVRNNLI